MMQLARRISLRVAVSLPTSTATTHVDPRAQERIAVRRA
jgi:hypothetical protein